MQELDCCYNCGNMRKRGLDYVCLHHIKTIKPNNTCEHHSELSNRDDYLKALEIVRSIRATVLQRYVDGNDYKIIKGKLVIVTGIFNTVVASLGLDISTVRSILKDNEFAEFNSAARFHGKLLKCVTLQPV